MTSTQTPVPVTDLADPVMFTDPFPRYAELRRTAPVSKARFNTVLRGEAFMLTRYDDVMQLHTDPRLSSDILTHSKGAWMIKRAPRILRVLTDTMVFKDDPDHKRLRGLVNKAFTPKRVQAMNDHIEAVVTELVDGLAERGGTVDLVQELAVPLPLRVIAEMMGVSAADRASFHHWTEEMTDAMGTGRPLQILKSMPTGRKMMKLFDRLATERRANPDDGLITAVVRAQEEDGDRLNDDEVVAMIFLLLLAGHDTTANLIGSSVLELLRHPDQLERLRAEPDLTESAVEELLRFTTPVPCGAPRIATEDLEIGGTHIPKGAPVLGMIISANRDEDHFERSEELDLGRQPNRHLTFAFGSHFCLGNQLARLEGRAALRALVDRFPDMRLAVPEGQLEYKPTQSLRGLKHLPLVLR